MTPSPPCSPHPTSSPAVAGDAGRLSFTPAGPGTAVQASAQRSRAEDPCGAGRDWEFKSPPRATLAASTPRIPQPDSIRASADGPEGEARGRVEAASPFNGTPMFNPFPVTYDLEPCNAFGGPAHDDDDPEDRARVARALCGGRTLGDVIAASRRGDDGPAPRVTDGHHEGDAPPVIGWAL